MRLRLRPEARLDLEAAARWYEAQEQGLGRLFLEEVRASFHRIRTNPEVYALGYRGTRRALIRRFPYGVIVLPVPAKTASWCWPCCIAAATQSSGVNTPRARLAAAATHPRQKGSQQGGLPAGPPKANPGPGARQPPASLHGQQPLCCLP
jgi:plasmid stabilization system protein ParE